MTTKRKKLKEDLAILGLYNPNFLKTFRLLYGYKLDEKSISEIVDGMSDKEINNATFQVKNTFVKIEKSRTDYQGDTTMM